MICGIVLGFNLSFFIVEAQDMSTDHDFLSLSLCPYQADPNNKELRKGSA
jgi:hypothetical protein